VKLADLILILETKGPSREADGMIWCQRYNGALEFRMWDGAGCVYVLHDAPKWDQGIKHIDGQKVLRYTTSVDDALSFAREMILHHDNGSQEIYIFTKAIERLSEKYDWNTNKRLPHQLYELATSICIIVLQELDMATNKRGEE
jgi:hypothetical protein